MAQRSRKKAAADTLEPPARKEIGTYDVARDYPAVHLIDADNPDDVREAWEINERVLVVIDGEKIAADPGDLVYKLKLPGSGEKLEVLSRDVAIAMYEIRPVGAIGAVSPFPKVIGDEAQEEHHPDAPPEPTVGEQGDAAELARTAQELNGDERDQRIATADRRQSTDAATDLEDRRDPENVRREADREALETEEDLDRIEHGAALIDAGIPLTPGVVAIMESAVRWMKKQRKAWRDLSEREQDNELADLDRILSERVRDLVVDIASREFPYVHATLEKVEFSDGIKATLTIPTQSEHRHELADHAKQTVTVVLAGAASWTAGDRPRPEPDQPKLV